MTVDGLWRYCGHDSTGIQQCVVMQARLIHRDGDPDDVVAEVAEILDCGDCLATALALSAVALAPYYAELDQETLSLIRETLSVPFNAEPVSGDAADAGMLAASILEAAGALWASQPRHPSMYTKTDHPLDSIPDEARMMVVKAVHEVCRTHIDRPAVLQQAFGALLPFGQAAISATRGNP